MKKKKAKKRTRQWNSKGPLAAVKKQSSAPPSYEDALNRFFGNRCPACGVPARRITQDYILVVSCTKCGQDWNSKRILDLKGTIPKWAAQQDLALRA